MGLKDLKRTTALTDEDRERQRQEFIAGAALQATPGTETVPAPKAAAKAPKKAKAERTIFSLTAKVNGQIDSLSLYPRTFKASRSDVVKAGVLALRAMSKADVVALLAQVTGASPSEEAGEDE